VSAARERRTGSGARRLWWGTGLLVLLLGATVLAAWPTDPLAVAPPRALEPPSWEHPLGTDPVGRDVLARVLHGGRRSLLAGLVATALACGLGGALGALAGSGGRTADAVLARLNDLVYAFPALVGALVLLSVLPGPPRGPGQAVRVGLVVGAFSWPVLFRYVRGEVRRVRHSDLALSARASGGSPWRVALRHMAPMALVPALVPASFLAAGTILVEAGLGFLGIGIRPPEPSWGNLLRDGMLHVERAWWLSLAPGALLFLTVLAFHLIGEGLLARMTRPPDPRTRGLDP
jgi:peptide/nickel transport system permease protein